MVPGARYFVVSTTRRRMVSPFVPLAGFTPNGRKVDSIQVYES